MQWSLETPSLLTPGLLDQLEALVQAQADPSTQLRSTVHAAQSIWSAQARSHEIAEIIRRHHALNEVDHTNFWFEAAATRWFCSTERIFAAARSDGLDRSEAQGAYYRAQVYPREAFTLLAQRSLAGGGLLVPSYFELELILEGEPVTLPFAANPIQLAPSGSPLEFGPGSLLAESQGLFSKAVPSSEATLATATRAPRGPQGNSARFAIRVRLTNPELLFVQQRQRSWLLTGLILSSGLAAGVGLVAAYRAFHRQLHLNELKGNFVSSVSHELRAPIASVRIMAENLERGKISDPGRRQEYFRFIVQECRRLSSLIENVLDFSRIEQGRKQFEFEPLDVVALVHETVKPLDAYASERQVALVVVGGPGLAGQQSLELNADGKALQQALVNLIDNAVKHSSKGQTVTVGLDLARPDAALGRLEPRHKKRLGTLFLWVEDQGEGIPAEEHQRIFERFYRVGSELRRQTQGVGIGLSIVKHVVEAHGGRVQVRSAIGQGSRFTIELPWSGHLEPKQNMPTPNET
jgi:signal transduction histidine kinase